MLDTDAISSCNITLSVSLHVTARAITNVGELSCRRKAEHIPSFLFILQFRYLKETFIQRQSNLECVVVAKQLLEKLVQFCTNDVSLRDGRVDVGHYFFESRRFGIPQAYREMAELMKYDGLYMLSRSLVLRSLVIADDVLLQKVFPLIGST